MTEADLDRLVEAWKKCRHESAVHLPNHADFAKLIFADVDGLLNAARRGLEAVRQERDCLREQLAAEDAAHANEIAAHQETLLKLAQARELVGKMLPMIEWYMGQRYRYQVNGESDARKISKEADAAVLAQARAMKILKLEKRMENKNSTITELERILEKGGANVDVRPDGAVAVAGLRKEIEQVLNRVSAENGSNTPDFILAEFLVSCLVAFDRATFDREKWYGQHFHHSTDARAVAAERTSD